MSAGRTARALRECSQQLETELAALTAERDQLRAAIALGQQNCDDAYDDLRAERDAARARAHLAAAALENLIETAPSDIDCKDNIEKYRSFVLRTAIEAVAAIQGGIK